MLPSIGVLYDRILSRRLDKWVDVHDEQTGFQKGKSTLTQIFTLRLLIEIARKSNCTIYIGCFDIAKAFDKVSRLLLLQKLIKCGVGYVMLNALKSIYTTTSCILSSKGKNSEIFNTTCGIRQGAPSSSLLFIVFINDLIDYVRCHCVTEPLIDAMHVLLHADDTLILSTQRSLFIKKCNIMIEYFNKNKLKLNLKKSGYLFIGGKENDLKETIHLDNGILTYKPQICYLGVLFSDTGRIRNDVCLFLADKRSHVTVKYTNFCSRNFLAPLSVKLAVLESCVMSSLTYSSETWGDSIPSEIESIYRMGIKTALSVRFSTCNEITYLEAGKYHAVCNIRKRQYNFWFKFKQKLVTGSSLEKLVKKAQDLNVPFINQYENLLMKYDNAKQCESMLQTECINTFCRKINEAYNTDIDSKLGTYLQVNPELKPPVYQRKMFELERIHITRIRTGSHNLYIETGRFSIPKVPREQRLCTCGYATQTVRHVLMECVLVPDFRDRDSLHTVTEFLSWVHIHEYLMLISKVLKIEL